MVYVYKGCYLFWSAQCWSSCEQDGTFGILDHRHQDLRPRCVPGLQVVRLVHYDDAEATLFQRIH